ARSIIGGLAVSVVLTVFIVPCAYYLIYRRKENPVSAEGVAVREAHPIWNQKNFMANAFCRTAAFVTVGFAACVAGAEELSSLTLQQAHETALRNHPQIRVADL